MVFCARIAALLWLSGFLCSLGFGADILPYPEVERLAAVVLSVAGAVVLFLSGGGLPYRALPAPGLALVVTGLWGLVMASCAWSVAPGSSLLYAGGFAVMPVTFLAVVLADPGARSVFLRMLLYAGGVVIFLLGLWAVAQVFLWPEYLLGKRVSHPFPNPNAYAGLLTLCMLAGLGIYMQETALRVRFFVLAVLAVMGMAQVAIASNAAVLTLAGGIVAFIVLCKCAGTYKHTRTMWGLLCVVAAVALFAVLVTVDRPESANIVSRLGDVASGGGGTFDNRVDIWRATLALIAENPFFGTGYRTFSFVYPAHRLPSEIYSGGYAAHADPLQLWTELGFAGIVLFYGAGVLVILRLVAWMRAGGRDPLTIALFAGCMAFVVHTHVDFLLYTLPTMMAFAIALAVLVIRTGYGDAPACQPFLGLSQCSPVLRMGILIFPVIATVFAFTLLMAAEIQVSRASAALQRGDTQAFSDGINAANRLSIGLNARAYSIAASVPLAILRAQFPAIPLEEQKTLFAQADGLINAALRVHKPNPAMYYHRAELVAHVMPVVLPPGYPSRDELLRRALAIDPLHVPSRVALADFLERAGDDTAAMDVLADGLDWIYSGYDTTPLYAMAVATAERLGREDLLLRAKDRQARQANRLKRSSDRTAQLQKLRARTPFLP